MKRAGDRWRTEKSLNQCTGRRRRVVVKGLEGFSSGLGDVAGELQKASFAPRIPFLGGTIGEYTASYGND